MGRPRDRETERRVIALYLAGWRQRDIVRRTGVPANRVSRILRRCAVVIPRYVRVTPAEVGAGRFRIPQSRFPPVTEDGFDLKPEHRRRLEEVRSARRREENRKRR